MDPENFRKKKLHNGKRSAAVLLVQYQFARHHFPPVRSRIHVQHFKSLLLDNTRKRTNASWNFAPRLPKMTERTRAEQENAQLKGKNYKWAKLETYHCLQTLLLLLKFLWSWTKESFVKNQSAALYKIGHISKEKDYWSEVVEDQVWFGAYKFMLFCDGHWKVLPRSDCCIEVRNKTSSLT